MCGILLRLPLACTLCVPDCGSFLQFMINGGNFKFEFSLRSQNSWMDLPCRLCPALHSDACVNDQAIIYRKHA